MDEIEALLGEVREAYGWFGLEPRFAFATKPDKAIGDPALWERAERLIRGGVRPRPTSPTRVKPKDGTFYAPKIDIYIDDALGREWQMATIQVDLTMLPERFDLTYIDEDGQPQRPIAIHRAIYGSLERFIGILVEHFAGAFPLWLAPVQAVVIPIADRHVEAAEELAGVLRARGLRVEVDDSDNRMQNKIRLAQEQKVPYMLVLGDREVEARTAPSPRDAARASSRRPSGWEALADRLAAEAARAGGDLSGDAPVDGRSAIVARNGLCYPPASARSRVVCRARRSTDQRERRGATISRDLRVNQMIRIPQVRVVDEEGAQLGSCPRPGRSRWRRNEASTSSRSPRWPPHRSSSSSTSASTSTTSPSARRKPSASSAR